MTVKHYDHDGRARFVTFSTHRGISLLTNNIFRQIVVGSIKRVRQQMTWRLLAYVIMPEHVHLVIIPGKDEKVGPLIGEIKRIAAIEIHQSMLAGDNDLLQSLTVVRNDKRRFVLWKRRCYDHNCRSEQSIWEKVNYCHNNPVKRGLVRNPEDWRWSSYRWYLGERDVPLAMDISVMSNGTGSIPKTHPLGAAPSDRREIFGIKSVLSRNG